MNSFEKIKPAEAGIHPKSILKFLERIKEENLRVHSFILMRHDAVLAEGAYAPYSLSEPHMLFSLSKSFTSIAIGFAVQEGLLKVEDKVLHFFQGKLPSKPCENMEKMTVKNLLTMNTGHDVEPFFLLPEKEKDWVYEFLTSYVAVEPGSHFLYNTTATYMLSAILQEVTGGTTFDYLKTRLFQPLDFSKDIWWETSPQGITVGGVGLNITTEDIAKFGSFLLHKGTYKGKQLLNKQWFDEAAAPWSDNSMNEFEDWTQGYGYQFWRCVPTNVYRGDGAFGQYCVIMPDQDMVLAMNSGESQMHRILTIFWEEILAKVSEVPENTESIDEYQNKLESKLSGLCLECYYEKVEPNCNELIIPKHVIGKKYEVSNNPFNISKITFSKESREVEKYFLSLEIGGRWSAAALSKDNFTHGILDLTSEKEVTQLKFWSLYSGLFEKIAVKGCTQNNTLYIDMAFVNTPFQDTWEIQFHGDGFNAHVKRNVGFKDVDFTMFGREVILK